MGCDSTQCDQACERDGPESIFGSSFHTRPLVRGMDADAGVAPAACADAGGRAALRSGVCLMTKRLQLNRADALLSEPVFSGGDCGGGDVVGRGPEDAWLWSAGACSGVPRTTELIRQKVISPDFIIGCSLIVEEFADGRSAECALLNGLCGEQHEAVPECFCISSTDFCD